MATKVHHIEAMPGTEQLFALISVISDTNTFKERLVKLEGVRDDINAALGKQAAKAKLGSIESQIRSAENSRDEIQAANNALISDGKAQAAKLVEDAKINAEKIHDAANQRNDESLTRERASKVAETELQEKVRAFDKRATALARAEKALADKESAVRDLEARLSARKQELSAVGVKI